MVWSCSWINTVFEKGSDCPSCLPSVRTNALCPTAPRQMKTSAIQRKRRDFFSLKLWMSYKFINYINHYQCFKQKKKRKNGVFLYNKNNSNFFFFTETIPYRLLEP